MVQTQNYSTKTISMINVLKYLQRNMNVIVKHKGNQRVKNLVTVKKNKIKWKSRNCGDKGAN